MSLFFISDVHLTRNYDLITDKFLQFLQRSIIQTEALYILGDLFEFWVGDDDNSSSITKIKQTFKQLTDSGVKIFLQVGNRDFLIGQRFCIETGIQLIGDYYLIELNHQRVLLTHGDLLCSDDIAYQNFRVRARNLSWQQQILSKPLWLRLLAARWYRFRSIWHQYQQDNIIDVNQKTVIDIMQQFEVLHLIHGHTHKPQLHQFSINQQPAQRWVLSDWQRSDISILEWNDQQLNYRNI